MMIEEEGTVTVRLFDQDSYIRTFEAEVTSCVPDKDHFLVCLDQTAFYPEGGGQPGDTGTLTIPDESAACGGKVIHVLDTHEKNDEICHWTDAPIEPGTRICGRIDWDRRFMLMQNHSGEHIVSGLIHSTFGYENVGFHMGSDFLTIDLSGELTMDDLADIQRRANEIVWQDIKTDIRFYEGSASIPFHYRSKKELTGQVRIVTFPGADICACCGTHVSSTGQIGLIKLISCVKFRSGVRIEMLCGGRAMDYLEKIWQQNHRISNLLSARPMQTAAAVERVMENEQEARFELIRFQKEKEEAFAAEMAGKGNVLILSAPLYDPQGVRRLANAIMEQCGGICAVFAGSDETDYKYAIGWKDGDLKDLVRRVNTALNGRGGGKPFFVQGSVAASRSLIEDLFLNSQGQDPEAARASYGNFSEFTL